MNESYINKGTYLKINGEGDANYALSAEGLANSAGRVSAQIDLGALPRPYIYSWSCECQWQATPVQGGGLELYIAGAPDGNSAQIDGDVGATDAALGDIDMRRNLKAIGYVTAENAAASEKNITSGVFEHYDRYLTVVIYNNAAASVDATDSNFKFNLQSVFFQPG